MALLTYPAPSFGLANSFVVLQLCRQPRIRHARKLAGRFQAMQVLPVSPTGSLVLVGDSLGVGVGAVDPAQSITGRLAARLRARMLYRAPDEVVRETQCLHLDLFQDARNNPLGEGPRRFYAEDGLHPSGEGYGIWFKELEKSLRTVV